MNSPARATRITLRHPAESLYPKQYEAFFGPERFGFVEGGTKSGKSHGGLTWVLPMHHGLTDRQKSWWVSPVYAQAEEMFERMRHAVSDLPPDVVKVKATDFSFKFRGSGTLVFKSGEKPDNLFAPDVSVMFLDEASRIRDKSFLACRSTLARTKGPMRAVGNVTNRFNWHYKACRRAQSGTYQNAAYHRLTYHDAVDAGILDQEEIDQARIDLEPFPGEFERLFEALDRGGDHCPFGRMDFLESRMHRLTDQAPFAWGWDLGKSVSYVVGIALDRQCRPCRFYRFRWGSKVEWSEITNRIIRECSEGRGLVDKTGVGSDIAERVARATEWRLTGFGFTETSRASILSELASGLSDRVMWLPNELSDPKGDDGPADQCLSEISHFEHVVSTVNGSTRVKWASPAGMADDCVMAAALAYRAYKTVAHRSMSTEDYPA